MIKLTKRLTLCFLVALLSIIGCKAGTDDTGTQAKHLKWKQIATFTGDVDAYYWHLADEDMRPLSGNEFAYSGRDPRLLILTDTNDMAAFQNQVRPEHQAQIRQVDFTKFWVAVIYQGYKSQPGYSIAVDTVRFQDNVITIMAQFEVPATSEAYQSTPVSPYLAIRIQKPIDVMTNTPQFELSVGGQITPVQCAITGDSLAWTKLRFTYQAGAYGYGGTAPTFSVITDYETWQDFPRIPPSDKGLISREEFASAFVVAVYQGLKSTTGFETEILSVRRQENTLVICVRFHEPYPGQAVGQAETSPYYLIKVQRPIEMQGDTMFVLCTDTQEIAQQTVYLP